MSDVQARVAEVLSSHERLDTFHAVQCQGCSWTFGDRYTLGFDRAEAHRAHVAAVLAEAGLLADHAYCNERVDRADQRTDAARAELAEVKAEWKYADLAWKEYQRGREDGRREAAGAIDFDTTCLNCAEVLEKSAKAYFDGEKAGMVAGAQQVRDAVEEERTASLSHRVAVSCVCVRCEERTALIRAAREAVARIEGEDRD